MSTFTKKRTSPSRDRLAECLAAKAEAEAKVASIQSSIERLAGHEEAVNAARSELTALDIADAAAVTAWAKSGEGSAPTTDVERRESIARALSQAESQARAAASARASLSSELETATKPLAGISAWSTVFVAQTVAEEMAPLLADLIDAQRNLAAKIERIQMLREFVLASAERLPKGSEEARQVYVTAEALASDMQRAMASHQAPLDDVVAARAALRDFVSALAEDAASRRSRGLEGINMHQISDSDPDFGTPAGILRAQNAKSAVMLAAAETAVAKLAEAVEETLAKRRTVEFDAYVATMTAGGFSKIMTRREFDEHMSAEAERQARIEKYS